MTHITNASGQVIESYRYDAFGAPTITYTSGIVTNNRFMFTGREYAPKFGIYEYRNRAYHPGLGRFMSEDPKLFDAGDYNLFRYCGNDPVDKIDPMGLTGDDSDKIREHQDGAALRDAQHQIAHDKAFIHARSWFRGGGIAIGKAEWHMASLQATIAPPVFSPRACEPHSDPRAGIRAEASSGQRSTERDKLERYGWMMQNNENPKDFVGTPAVTAGRGTDPNSDAVDKNQWYNLSNITPYPKVEGYHVWGAWVSQALYSPRMAARDLGRMQKLHIYGAIMQPAKTAGCASCKDPPFLYDPYSH